MQVVVTPQEYEFENIKFVYLHLNDYIINPSYKVASNYPNIAHLRMGIFENTKCI